MTRRPKPRQRARTRKMRVWLVFHAGRPALSTTHLDIKGKYRDRFDDYRPVTLVWQEPRRKR